MECEDGRYYYAAGSSPPSLAFAAVVILSYCALLASRPSENLRPVKGVVRRWIAFWLDFLIAMAAIGPIIGMIEVFAEWFRTGGFEWSFERTEAASGDAIVNIGTLILAFLLISFYFALPLVAQRPSPGSCILGYRVIADNRQPLPMGAALKRTALGFTAAIRVFRGIGTERNPDQGKFWLDFRFNTRAVEL
jgi:uncharacterized RDD family membrane protein YckC